jgi:hypothetical protein
MFGLNAQLPESGTADYQIERVVINGAKKKKIRDELFSLNIHRGTIYPNVESSAIVVRDHYGD